MREDPAADRRTIAQRVHHEAMARAAGDAAAYADAAMRLTLEHEHTETAVQLADGRRCHRIVFYTDQSVLEIPVDDR